MCGCDLTGGYIKKQDDEAWKKEITGGVDSVCGDGPVQEGKCVMWGFVTQTLSAVGVYIVHHKRNMEKGSLLNNAYLYASKEQRETMDKKPYYRQSAVIFFILGVVFIVVGLSLVLQDDRILLFEIPLIFGTIIYAVVSSFQIGRKRNKQS